MNALPQSLDRLTDQMSSDDIFQLAYAVRQRAIDKRRAELGKDDPMNTFDNRRHPMTPGYLEYPSFDESAGFDPVPCAPQVIGRIEHHREGEPVRVALTAAGLSLPDGALLYAQPDHIADAGKKVAPDVQAGPLRYTHDGALAECPCCGSLDVGGAHDTVHCQSCGLTVTKPRPLQNAIDAWNTRTGRTHPAPTNGVQGDPVRWLNIVSLPHTPDEDQVFWFARSDGYIEGPREIQQGGYDYEEFEFYCPAVPPSLYAAPQPAEQAKPALVAWVLYDATADQKYIKVSVDDGSLAIFESETAARRARTMHQGTDYKRCEYYSALQPAEQQPDVTQLVGALGSMTCAYRMAIQAGHARITALGGDCDSVDRMLSDFPEYGKAVELYKSYRKGGDA